MNEVNRLLNAELISYEISKLISSDFRRTSTLTLYFVSIAVVIQESGRSSPINMLGSNLASTLSKFDYTYLAAAAAPTTVSDHYSYQYVYNHQFQVDLPSANVQPLNFTYDDDGNLTSDGIRSYQWDMLSPLTKITWATGKTTAFKYNALGQRCDRTDTDGGTVTKHYYLFDGAEMFDHRIGSSASTATVDRRYFAQGEQRKNGTNWDNYFYCRDHLGSIREVVKSTGGTNTLVARYDYDPYGKRLTQYESSAYTCDLGYTGHVTVPSLVAGQTDMVLTHFRAYDAELAIWLSADPLGEAGGLNLYAYCYGNPLNLYDPDGMMPSAAWWGGFFDFDQGTVDALGVGAMATIDGAIPFADPFQNSGGYDPCQDGVGFSKAAGGIARDVGLAALTAGGSTYANVAAQAKNPLLYKLGSTTVSRGTWRFLKHTSVVNRGRIHAAKNGGLLNAFRNESSFGRALPNVGSGLTPLGSFTASGFLHGLDSAYNSLSGNNSECP